MSMSLTGAGSMRTVNSAFSPSCTALPPATVTVQSSSSMVITIEPCDPTVTPDGSFDASITIRKVSSPSHRASFGTNKRKGWVAPPCASNVTVAFLT